jgi:hypothetical protein
VHTRIFTSVTPSLDPDNSNIASAELELFSLLANGNIDSRGPFVNACSASAVEAQQCPSTFDGDLSLTLPSGASERVYLILIIAASANAGGVSTAWIDPYIHVDPQFAQAATYAIRVTDGVSNAAPVPEAGPGLLLVSGLGVLALRVWRRA